MIEFAAAMPHSMDEMVDILRVDLMLKLLLAVAMGGAIGVERQLAGKPAGLRTNILICMGSALLMDLSINLVTPKGALRTGEAARIAAQVVTGIGFLGAGTIMQDKGTVTGLTSAATIWVVCAIGLTIGAGYTLEAVGATVIVLLVLAALAPLEHKLLRATRFVSATITVQPGTTVDAIQQALRDNGIKVISREVYDHLDDRVLELRLSGPAAQFELVSAKLAARGDVLSVHIG
jgi:putative Mg2+ transporter-C (MgtC) family protein